MKTAIAQDFPAEQGNPPSYLVFHDGKVWGFVGTTPPDPAVLQGIEEGWFGWPFTEEEFIETIWGVQVRVTQ